MPVLDREEYIEQAYFFQAFRERLADGQPAQYPAWFRPEPQADGSFLARLPARCVMPAT